MTGIMRKENLKLKRFIKIYPKVRILNKKLIKRRYYETSQIKLEGNYLVNAGFRPNTFIQVLVTENQILITTV